VSERPAAAREISNDCLVFPRRRASQRAAARASLIAAIRNRDAFKHFLGKAPSGQGDTQIKGSEKQTAKPQNGRLGTLKNAWAGDFFTRQAMRGAGWSLRPNYLTFWSLPVSFHESQPVIPDRFELYRIQAGKR
jgi:hypothetical protein